MGPPLLSDAERSKACAKLQSQIADAQGVLHDLVAIVTKNPKLADKDAGPRLYALLAQIDKLRKEESDLCVLHFTMPPPPPPSSKPAPQVGQDSRTQQMLRAISKACNDLQSGWGQVRLTVQQLQPSAGEAWGQTRQWQRFQSDLPQIAGGIQMLCPQPH